MNPLADVHQYCANLLDGEMPLSMVYAAWPLRPGTRPARILTYGFPCPTLGRNASAAPDLGDDVHDRSTLFLQNFFQFYRHKHLAN